MRNDIGLVDFFKIPKMQYLFICHSVNMQFYE